ncbi:recombinase family protein [Candidatus Jidaibacter acanthamoebae]|uniref:recombinase family protein n=1 Tax=Candidatus Jidaibacter acanthamoebae TaxID=86105 RepID=UPI0006A6C837
MLLKSKLKYIYTKGDHSKAGEKRGIGLRSLSEAIDTTNSGVKLIFHIFGALVEFGRSLIRDRTMAGYLLGREGDVLLHVFKQI